MDDGGVSVVIPVRNRAGIVGRAITSALDQRLPPAEVIVVDDSSSDGTLAVVESFAARDPRVRVVRSDSRRGAAAARNAGIRAARHKVLAFLDSDDEWTASHLERAVGLLRDSGAGLVFGSFFVDDGRSRLLQRCRAFQGDPLEYLFLTSGGFRTSTFVCAAESMRDVMFDEELRKHQDWDLMINFRRRDRVVTDSIPTAVLHIGGADRMSAKLDHPATEAFFRKNRRHCSQTGWVLFVTVMLQRAYRAEGRGPNYSRYLALVEEIDPVARGPIEKLSHLLRVPRIGSQLFRAAARRYCAAAVARHPESPSPGGAS